MLTAAATRIRLDAKGRVTKRAAERWQKDAWDFYDLIGEVKQAVTFLANVVGSVRLYIAEVPDDPEQEPSPAEPGTPGVVEAEMALERLRTGSVYGGLGGLLAESVVNLKVAGEYYLVGEPEVPGRPEATEPELRIDRPEQWDVKSVDEVEIKDRGLAVIHSRPGDDGRKVKLPGPTGSEQPEGDDTDESVFMLRVWQRHPRYSDLADSALRAVITECDELLLLSKAIRATARSRLAGAGILVVPDELDFPPGPDEGDSTEDPEVDPFMRRLAVAMTTPISDEGSPDAVVPLVLRGPADLIEKVQHILMDRPLDRMAGEQRKELIERLGHSLDIPVEQLTGMANVNHWTAWQVDGASWARYGQPTTRLICESWTEGYLWNTLEEMGLDRSLARRLMIWFDPADAIVDPDQSKSADEAWDRITISDEAYRTRKGFSEEDAPDDEEWQRRAGLRGAGRAAGMGDENGPPAQATRLHLVASAAPPLGERLMRIDRALRARLEEAASAAVQRAVRTAGARARSRAQGDAGARAAVASCAAHEVVATLGRSMVAALGLVEDELVGDEIASMHPTFESRTRAAQAAVRDELYAEFDLSDDELLALERQQDDDRAGAWLWFSGALVALTRERLYNPAPAAPPMGEFTEGLQVPPGMVREAMARAGGGLPAADQPPGGVATGTTVLDLWQQHGHVVAGWEWVYGDPGTRTTPFDPHLSLDGVSFASWEDPVLTNSEPWPELPYYRPGDHDWCQCDFVPVPVGEGE